VIRLIFVVLLALTILNPEIKVRKSIEEKRAVLVDVSKSMQGERIRRAKDIAKVFRGNFDFFIFSKGIKRIEKKDIKNVKADGNFTDIYSALNELSGYKDVYVISDGKNNIFDRERNYGFRVNTIYCGEKILSDSLIRNIDYPNYVFEDSPITIDLGVEFRGDVPENSYIYIKENKNIIKKISFIPRPYKVVKFSFNPTKAGKREYRIILKSLSKEKNRENNIRKIRVNVLPSRIRVLYICGRPGWEYRFLRNFLKSNPRIELVSFIILRNPEDVALVKDRELSLIPFPAKEIFLKDIFKYNLFVLENFDYKRFIPSNYLEKVREYIYEGGNFLMIGGENSFGRVYSNTAIKDVLPVIMSGNNKFLIKDFKIRIKEKHPITGEKDRWKNLPIMTGINEVNGIRGKVLLETEEGLPYLVVGEFGKGRVGAVLGNTTWRWSFIKDRKYFYWDFWKRFIYWLLRFPFVEEFDVNLNKRKFRIGEECVLKIKSGFKESKDIRVIIFSPDGKKEEGKLSYDWEKKRAVFKYRFEKKGIYKIFIRKKDLRRNFTVFVKDLNIELDDIEANPKFLKDLSSRTNGKFFNYEDINKLKEFLKKEKYYKRIYPARSKYFLGLLILILSLSWLKL